MPSRPPIARGAAAPARLFVDSGAWIALRSRRDQHHADADRLVRQALARRIRLLTTNLVIAETHRLTLFRAGSQPALRALELIDASPSVTIHFPTADDHAGARRWLERLAPRPITYTDAVSFAVMEASQCRHVLGPGFRDGGIHALAGPRVASSTDASMARPPAARHVSPR